MKTGQVDIFGGVSGLDKLVTPPRVIESDGLKVVHFAVSERDRQIPGYVYEVKAQGRAVAPEVKSRGKPYFLTAEYQAKRRKALAGKA